MPNINYGPSLEQFFWFVIERLLIFVLILVAGFFLAWAIMAVWRSYCASRAGKSATPSVRGESVPRAAE